MKDCGCEEFQAFAMQPPQDQPIWPLFEISVLSALMCLHDGASGVHLKAKVKKNQRKKPTGMFVNSLDIHCLASLLGLASFDFRC
jgi:hypothetical protein